MVNDVTTSYVRIFHKEKSLTCKLQLILLLTSKLVLPTTKVIKIFIQISIQDSIHKEFDILK